MLDYKLTIITSEYTTSANAAELVINIQKRIIRENMIWDGMDPNIRVAAERLIEHCRNTITQEEIKILKITAKYIRDISTFANR